MSGACPPRQMLRWPFWMPINLIVRVGHMVHHQPMQGVGLSRRNRTLQDLHGIDLGQIRGSAPHNLKIRLQDIGRRLVAVVSKQPLEIPSPFKDELLRSDFHQVSLPASSTRLLDLLVSRHSRSPRGISRVLTGGQIFILLHLSSSLVLPAFDPLLR